jgi:hypothetical protein
MCLRVINKKKYEKNYFFASLKSLKKGVGSGSINQRCGSVPLINRGSLTLTLDSR